MDKIIGIYKIENKVNGHVYIGQSINIRERWFEHRGDLRNNKHINSHLQNAWNKYGENNFVHKIIEMCEVYDLDDREKYWISFYDSANKHKGYNISPGGQGSHGTSDETRAKLSASGKGRTFTKERNENLSKKLKGRVFSDEHKLHLSLSWQFRIALKHPDTWYKNKTKLPPKKLIGENNPYSKYTDEEIKVVIFMLLTGKSNLEISGDTGVTLSVISKIRRKQSWNHLTEGMEFPYVRSNGYTKEINNKILEDIKSGFKEKEIITKYNISRTKIQTLKHSLKEVS